MNFALTHVAGRVGDHNDRAMLASPALAEALAQRLGASPVVLGQPEPALSTNWDDELAAGMPLLERLADRFEGLFREGSTPITALSRCAPALATLPVVARHRPEAVVVWFDAHADLNTPENTTTGYLGGLALSGPLGLWRSGLGAGLDPRNVVLVGTRDLDAPEQRLVDEGTIALVPVGDGMADQLRDHIAARPVYVHIDCDVLEPHTVPTDYLVPGGMSLAQLHECAQILARSEVVGVEIGELEASSDATDESPERLIVKALKPLLVSESANAP